MEKIECNVGDAFVVETPGKFRLAANAKQGLYLVPEDGIKIARDLTRMSPETRRKLDKRHRGG